MKWSDAYPDKAAKQREREAYQQRTDQLKAEPRPIVEIIGTVRQVRNWSVLLWDCPEQRWYSLPNQEQADLLQRCCEEKIKVRVKVEGINVKEIVI